MTPSQEQRFWAKVDVGDCWHWLASVTPDGYGHFRLNGRIAKAHRVAWEFLVGPIPAGLTLDHLCRNRSCVNPDHLEPVDRRENIRRGVAGAHNRNKGECSQGHPFTTENTRIHAGGRTCRTCHRIWVQEWRERQAA
jgi:hypothetical protein